MSAKQEFEKWGLGYSGCDGGDIGSPESRSIWVCGIEWGGGGDPQEINLHFLDDVDTPPSGYGDWKANVNYIFNWQLMKLLGVLHGHQVENYKVFAETVAPFVIGKKGYFKMNLFPIAFKNTANSQWQKDFATITGFETKADYLQWCRSYRLAQLAKWCRAFSPEIVLCLGKSYADDFRSAFLGEGRTVTEVIDGRDLSWGVNNNGTLVVILPFMVNRNGLVKNTIIQKFGERISELRLLTSCSSRRS